MASMISVEPGEQAVGCRQCGAVFKVPDPPDPETEYRCVKCHNRYLTEHERERYRMRAALCASVAAILYWPAMKLPMLNIDRFGQKVETGLVAGVEKLYHSGYEAFAIVIFCVSVVFPAVKCVALLLESIVPSDKPASRTMHRFGVVWRAVLKVPVSLEMIEMMAIAVFLVSLAGPYGIRILVMPGVWVFMTMLLCKILSSMSLKRSHS